MTNRLLSLAVVTAASALVLTACTFSANLTVPASQVATTAEDALEAQIGSRPEIDCGTDSVPLVNGTEVDCVLTDPATGERYEAPVTISNVDGSKFTVNVDVADAPIGGGSTPEPTETSVTIPEDAPTVTGTDLSAVVVRALAPELGYTPVVSCFLDVAIVVGNTTNCTLTDEEGAVSDVLVTITEFDGSNYSINAKVLN